LGESILGSPQSRLNPKKYESFPIFLPPPIPSTDSVITSSVKCATMWEMLWPDGAKIETIYQKQDAIKYVFEWTI